MKIGLLHPGAMGAAVGQAIVMSGHDVFWLDVGRSTATRQRAEAVGLVAVSSMADLVQESQAVVSVCPPANAVELARSVLLEGYTGFYLDANAIAPQTAQTIADDIGESYIDGGIIGVPPQLGSKDQRPSTRLYLSGLHALQAQDWFAGGHFGVQVLSPPSEVASTAASALKMCYAAYTKGSSALILAVRALAEANDVGDALLQEWGLSQPGLSERSDAVARGTGPKAWRFVAEMQEIASTLEHAGLPTGFFEAAGDIFKRLSPLKTEPDVDWLRVERLLNSNRSTKTD